MGARGELSVGGGGFMGACYHPDTHIKTEEGWKLISDLRVGDACYSLNPKTMEVEFVPIAKTFSYPYDGDLIQIKGEFIDQLVTPNHLVFYKTRSNDWGFGRADTLPEDFDMMNDLGEYNSKSLCATDHYYNGQVYCCQLERNHVLLTRYGDKTVWSGNSWDATVPSPSIFREILRVLKPAKEEGRPNGAFFAGTRTLHLMMASLRLAGFEIMGVDSWVYGCLDDQTEVYVKGKGWVTYGGVGTGDMVRAFTPKGAVKYMPIQEVIKIPDYDDIAYHLRGPGVDQLVSHNHKIVHLDTTGNNDPRYACDVIDYLAYRGDIGGSPQPLMIPYLDPRGEVKHGHVAITPVPRYQGMMWCVKVATGMIVVRRNGKVSITHNSGFPKSLNIHKQLLKNVAARYGDSRCQCEGHEEYDDDRYHEDGRLDLEKKSPRQIVLDDYDDNKLVTRVCSWCALPDQGFIDSTNGLGTALKPAWEPCIIVGKPSVEINIDYDVLLPQYGFSEEDIRKIMTPY